MCCHAPDLTRGVLSFVTQRERAARARRVGSKQRSPEAVVTRGSGSRAQRSVRDSNRGLHGCAAYGVGSVVDVRTNPPRDPTRGEARTPRVRSPRCIFALRGRFELDATHPQPKTGTSASAIRPALRQPTRASQVRAAKIGISSSDAGGGTPRGLSGMRRLFGNPHGARPRSS